ncbi:hypothetical protein ACOMHN_004786 [Nucella lapillus]
MYFLREEEERASRRLTKSKKGSQIVGKMSQTPATRRQLRERDSPSTSSMQSTGRNSSQPSGLVVGGSGSPSAAKIRTRLSTGTLIMNGTSTIKEKDTRTPPSTPGSDSSKSALETPAAGSKRQAMSAEVTVPLKQRRITRSDVRHRVLIH